MTTLRLRGSCGEWKSIPLVQNKSPNYSYNLNRFSCMLAFHHSNLSNGSMQSGLLQLVVCAYNLWCVLTTAAAKCGMHHMMVLNEPQHRACGCIASTCYERRWCPSSSQHLFLAWYMSSYSRSTGCKWHIGQDFAGWLTVKLLIAVCRSFRRSCKPLVALPHNPRQQHQCQSSSPQGCHC